MNDVTHDPLREQITTNLRLTRELADALDAQARREGGSSRAALIRRLCVTYLKANAPQDAPTLREAA